jgi:4-hydroxybenzoate polyprenyltransferase
MPAPRILGYVLHFVGWRRWGVLFHNPVLENTFIFQAVALSTGAESRDVIVTALVFLALSMALFSFGYLLNDAVDRERDAPHRSDNAFAGHPSSWTAATVVGLAMAANVPAVAWFCTRQPAFGALWGAWLVTAFAYSMPGLYLKARGWWGLVDVALALRTLPIAMALVALRAPLDLVAALALAYVTLRGLSADMAHQILHAAEDGANAVATLGVRMGPDRASRLLQWLLRLERFALLAMAVVLAVRLGGASAWAMAALCANLIALAVLVGHAERRILARQADPPNPHSADYRPKDVFYLLHKSYPKLLLPAALTVPLAATDAAWLLLLAPPVLVYRAFSPRKILNALRIRPEP